MEQDFCIPVEWDTIGASIYKTNWEFVIDADRSKNLRIGILSTSAITEMVKKHLNPSLGNLVDFYVRGCTLIYDYRCEYNSYQGKWSAKQLELLLLCAGVHVLRDVDARLQPDKLANSSPATLNALFLSLMLIVRGLDFMIYLGNRPKVGLLGTVPKRIC
jgi:hypothetical protein